MAVIEQLICGRNPSSPDSGRTVLARSPGIGAGVSEEIVKFCSDWGSPPPGGLLRPVVLSFPLTSAMPAIRGYLYAIIRINTVVPAFFHAVVMSKADFRSFDYNPYAVVQAGSFLDNCNVEGHLAKGHIEPLGPDSLFSPPPNPADVGLVDEALQQFLTKGKLVLNLEANTAQSDRVLSLMIHLMPLAQKEKLRFASFSTSGDNHYSLATAYTLDTPFSSWQRLFMTLIDQGTPETVRKYIATIRNGLAVGDLGNLNKSSVTAVPQPKRATSQRGPVQEPISSRSVPFIKEAAPPRQPALSTRSGPTPDRVASVPMTAVINSGSSSSAMDSLSRSRVGTGNGRPSRTRLVRQSMPMSRKGVRKQSHALLTFFVAVAVLAAGWIYLDRSGKGQEWGLFDLLNQASRQETDSKAASLLEVVDVGAEYSRQLGKIQRAKLLPGSDRDQALRRAQADLQADAAGPLLIQAELFLQLTDSGIQQSSRPDREMARLQSLANQGQVLVEEMGRLELAYYSFQQGILWQDLGTLPDAQVRARRDSLVKAAPQPMGTVTQEVGTGPYWKALPAAQRNAAGMAGLLTLFQSDAWSKEWESGMKRAAEMVSPSASPMSRAYRNNAFTLVRLKRAERQEANLAGSYNRPFGKGEWPAESVQEILAELRRRASLFTSQERPALLSETLVLYAGLSDPEPLAKKIAGSEPAQARLEQNLAVKFDPAVYENYLSRIRFEAMAKLLESGTEPADLPARLLRGLDPQSVAFFNDLLKENENTANWPAMTAMAGESFLGRWSRRQERLVQSRTASMRDDIDKAWIESQDLLGQLMERARRGEDWTSIWVDLQGELSRILAYSPSVIQSDSSGASWWTQAADLKAQLEVSRPLDFQSVVVRLGPQPLPEPIRVYLELQVDMDGRSFESPLFALGPSAPEGSGWVGTSELDWQPEISPADSFTARVFLPGQDTPLVEVNYPSLVERVGPGALVRSRRSDSGSLVFRTTDRWWRTIQILEVP